MYTVYINVTYTGDDTMYTAGTTVKTVTNKMATIIDSSTVEVMNEDGTCSESTTYDAHILGEGNVTLHETKILSEV
jgi:hypothetical protein